MNDYLSEVFGDGGLFASRFPGYEMREGQVALARMVDEAMRGGRHALGEGPCGTGKSVAYAVPAVYRAHHDKKRVVIATANIALQEQLVRKDLPMLASVLPWPFTFALLKGRNNYVCLDRLTMNMLMSFAEFEREMISERTRDKIAGARRKGKWTGGPVPFGYSTKDKKLYVNDVEAHIVREAFTLFLQHRQMAVVARELNRLGLQPRASRRQSKRGLLWTKDTIARVLRSPLCVGLMMHGDAHFPGEHPPLIEEATFQEAQRLLGESGRELRVHGTNPEYVLRGLLCCGTCGDLMTPASTTKKSGKTYRFYRCSRRDKYGKELCPGKPLPAGAIEDFVVTRLEGATADGTLAERTKAKLEARIVKSRVDYVTLRDGLNARIADYSAGASKLADEVARLDGRARELVEAKLRIEANNLEAAESQLRAVERDAVNLELDAQHLDWFVSALRDFGKVWTNMTPENQGRLLRAIVAKVVVDEAKGKCRVELMNFEVTERAKEAA